MTSPSYHVCKHNFCFQLCLYLYMCNQWSPTAIQPQPETSPPDLTRFCSPRSNSLSLSHSPFFFRRSHPQTYHIWWLCCQHWSLDPSCFWVSILIPIHSSISLFFFLVLWWFLHQGFVGCAVFFPFNFPFLSLIIFQGKFVIQPAF